MELYMIIQVSTGKWLPCAKDAGRNFSATTPTDKYAPRLFSSKAGAHSALARWCEGVWSNHWEDGLEVDTPKVKRDRKDMEVVNVNVTRVYQAGFRDKEICSGDAASNNRNRRNYPSSVL